MKLNLSYDNKEDVPEAYVDLFTEVDDKWVLTEVTGFKTQADIDRIQASLATERDAHKATKLKFKPLEAFEDMDLEQLEKDQIELTELRVKIEAGAGEGFDQEKFDEAVERLATARTATAAAPLKRDLEKMTEERDTLSTENEGFKSLEVIRTVTDAVRTAATGIKVVDTAMEDVLMLGERVFEIADDGAVITKEGVGVTPGIAPDIWLAEMQPKRPHWWPSSTGGGAGGGTGAGGFSNNPWSTEHWNLTAQGQQVRADGSRAELMAKAAGTIIGGMKPVDKPAKAA